MGRIDALKTTIDANIRENGNQEITGEILNLVLNEMVSVVDVEKQERLMDGVNIKTINGQNVLGRGNIEIEGGGGGSSVEVVDSLDSEDTTAALSANQGRVLKEMIEELPSGGGGITEEKEVYIGTQPTEDAKLWIDPTGTPSGGNGGGTSGGGSNVFVFPEEVMSGDYTEESPYSFTPEKTAEFLAALENPSSVYVAYQNAGGYVASLHFNIHTVYGFDAVCVSYAMGYLSVMIIHMMVEDGIVKTYKETQMKEL